MPLRGLAALVVAFVMVTGTLVSIAPMTLAAPANPSASAPVGWINITATADYGYTPPYFQQLPTNASITVTLTDGSDLPHTFTIIGREGWVVPSTYNPAQIDDLAYGGHPNNLANVNVSGSGDVESTTFTSPGPGWYEFLCTVSGHFQLGMFGFVAFGINLPSNLTSGGRTGVGGHLTFTVVDAVLVAVVVVAAAGGLLYLRRRQRRERFGT